MPRADQKARRAWQRAWYAHQRERLTASYAKAIAGGAAGKKRARAAAAGAGLCTCGETLAEHPDGRKMSGCRACLDVHNLKRRRRWPLRAVPTT